MTLLPRRSLPFLIALNLATFGTTFWNSVANPSLYQYKLEGLAARDVINTLLGLFVIAGQLTATFAQPVWGALSDRTRSRFGRRAPYLVLGALGVALSAFALSGADSLLVVFGVIVLSQIASNAVQGPYQALSPDQLPDSQKGASAGLKTFLELLAVLCSGIAVRQLLATNQTATLAILLAGVALISVLVTVLAVPEGYPAESVVSNRPQATPDNMPLRRLLTTEYRALHWWLLNRFLFWAGLVALRGFIIGYLRDVGGFATNEALALSGDFTVLLGLGVVLVTIPAGALSDRVGRVRLIAAAGLIGVVGAALLIVTRSIPLLQIAAVVAGAGGGMYFSVNWALVTSLVPPRDAALFLGIANTATTLGSVAGQLGGPLIDLINRATGTYNGYFAVFGLAGACFLLSVFAIARIDEKAEKELTVS